MKQKTKKTEEIDAETMESNIAKAKENLRLFIDKQ